MCGPLRGPAAFDDGENNYQSDYLCTGREFAPCFPSERQARWHQRLRGHKGICADSRGWISMGDRLARGRSAVPGRRAAPPPRAGGSSPVGVPSAATPSQLSDRYAIRTRGNSRQWPRAGKGVRAQLAKPRGASLVVVFLASKCAAERALRTGASALAARSIDEFVEVKCWFSHARERRGGSIGGLISVVVARKTGELRHRARYGGSLSGRQKVCA